MAYKIFLNKNFISVNIPIKFKLPKGFNGRDLIKFVNDNNIDMFDFINNVVKQILENQASKKPDKLEIIQEEDENE